jgi:ketosteroid isomerase-like protein
MDDDFRITVCRMAARLITGTLLLSVLVSAYADVEIDTESAAVNTVLAIQDQLHEFGIAGDAKAFGALISADFVASDPSNTIRHRDEIVALVSSGRLRYESIETSIDYARQIGDDLVVIIGTESTLQSDLESVATSHKLKRRFTNVYRKENGEWRLLIKQSTIIAIE